MINEKKYKSWYLITIDDAPKFLIGKSFIDILQLFLSTNKFNFIISDAMDGSGGDWVISDLQDDKDTIFSFDEILKILYQVNQLDWGDFFLFKNYPQNWVNEGYFYPDKITQTDATIRAVDNQYLYIYTPDLEIVELIKNNYTIEEIKNGPLDTLDFPY
jgi:hypothetical protein